MFRKGVEYKVTGKSWNPFKRSFVLLKDYTFNFMDAEYTIPQGFEWDGPSGVPVIRWITDGWVEPSLVHDWLYVNHYTLTQNHLFSQEDVDDRFLYDLSKAGVGWMTRFIIDKFYTGRIFARYWDESEPVKISFPLIRDYVVAFALTLIFLFVFYKFQGALVTAFLGLFGG